MKSFYFGLVLVGGIIFVSTLNAVAEQDKGPETMDLKERFKVEGQREAVIFKHRMHQAKLECIKCHVNKEGGGDIRFELKKTTGISNDFHKKFCWPCHEEMKVPKGKACNTCHKK